MPFIGKDWRSTGETWIRVAHTSGWEQVKLRPIQLGSCHDSSLALSLLSEMKQGDLTIDMPSSLPADSKLDENFHPMRLRSDRHQSSSSLELHTSSTAIDIQSSEREYSNDSFSMSPPDHDGELHALSQSIPIKASDAEDTTTNVKTSPGSEPEEKWIPHCYVKTTRSKEFIGCTSMSEAFHRLDLARAVGDVRRFNYICRVVQILVHEKLKNISATARKHLFAIIQSIVINSAEKDIHVSVARDLLTRFSAGLEEGHVCGSPSLVNRQLGVANCLMDMIVQERKPTTLADSNEESMTFLDLPREIISLILRRLPDHTSLLEIAKAHEAFEAIIESETRMWKSLCQFHFTIAQIDKHRQGEQTEWRHTFFELKKYYGLREIYADLIHICCHCKALFWKDHGHPCVGKDSPSVRVTPQQFVDMLLFL